MAASNSHRQDEDHLLRSVRKLYLADVAQLSPQKPAQAKEISSMAYQYMRYLVNTWGDVLHGIIFLNLSPIDFFAALTFALGSSVFLGVMLVICIIYRIDSLRPILASCTEIVNKYILNIQNLPRNAFGSITQAEVDAACAALSRPPTIPTHKGDRVFDVDIAKLLLQLSALMYERGDEPITSAIAAQQALYQNATSGSQEIDGLDYNHATDNSIRDFCHTFGLCYAPVSELNASDSAYAALFWHPKSCWIVVAFKGTTPIEYAEWVSNFTYEFVDAGDWLPGFSRGGFLERIFPADVTDSGGNRPWDTIISGIKLVAQSLTQQRQLPEGKINLFFTGHSLGCAIASLAFARTVLVERDVGEHVIVRDGYIFAAPITCDVASVKTFTGAINRDCETPKTLWRVTNMEDIVATGLPEYGDTKRGRFSNDSLLNFAHLGAEVKLRKNPVRGIVVGWPLITRGVPVTISSNLEARVAGEADDYCLPVSTSLLERLPFVGRIMQHATIFYWDKLQRVGLGLCQWADN